MRLCNPWYAAIKLCSQFLQKRRQFTRVFQHGVCHRFFSWEMKCPASGKRRRRASARACAVHMRIISIATIIDNIDIYEFIIHCPRKQLHILPLFSIP